MTDQEFLKRILQDIAAPDLATLERSEENIQRAQGIVAAQMATFDKMGVNPTSKWWATDEGQLVAAALWWATPEEERLTRGEAIQVAFPETNITNKPEYNRAYNKLLKSIDRGKVKTYPRPEVTINRRKERKTGARQGSVYFRRSEIEAFRAAKLQRATS